MSGQRIRSGAAVVVGVGGLVCLFQAIRLFLPSVMFIGILIPGMDHVRMAALIFATLTLGMAASVCLSYLPRQVAVALALVAQAALFFVAESPWRLWLSGAAVMLWMASLAPYLAALPIGRASAILLALIVDRMLSTVVSPIDFLWHRGPSLFSVLEIALLSLAIALSGSREKPAAVADPGPWRWVLAGGGLFLALNFWVNPLRFAALVGLEPWVATAIGLGLAAVSLLLAELAPLARRETAAVSLLMLFGAALITESHPVLSLVLGLPALGLVLGIVLLPCRTTSARLAGLGLSGGVFLSVILIVLFFLSYSTPIGFPQAWLAPAAAIGLAVGAWGAPLPSGPPGEWRALFAGGAIAALMATVAVSLWPSARAMSAPEAFPIRVASYNIQMGFGADGWGNLKDITSEIARENADVVLLQEVSRATLLAGGWDTVGWFASRLGYQYAYHGIFGPQLGQAVLSRFPIALSGREPLPIPRTTTPVGYVWAEIIVGKERLRIANAHLEDGDDQESTQSRLAEIAALAETACGDEMRRCIVGGDLNSPAGREEIAPLSKKGLRDAYVLAGGKPGEGLTAHSARPEARIDYLWISPDLRALDFHTGSSLASDHFLVSARLEASGPSRKAPAPAAAAPTAEPKLGERVYQAVCAACHSATAQGMGPSVKEIREKYQGNPAGIVSYAKRPTRVRQNLAPMPSQSYLGDEKLRAVAEYMVGPR